MASSTVVALPRTRPPSANLFPLVPSPRQAIRSLQDAKDVLVTMSQKYDINEVRARKVRYGTAYFDACVLHIGVVRSRRSLALRAGPVLHVCNVLGAPNQPCPYGGRVVRFVAYRGGLASTCTRRGWE